MKTNTAAQNEKKSFKHYIWLIIIILIALLIAIVWWLNYRKYITTDDANLATNRINLSTQVMAPVIKIYGWEGNPVKAGQLLLELDSISAQYTLLEAKARETALQAALTLHKELYNQAITAKHHTQNKYKEAQRSYTQAKHDYQNQIITQEFYQQASDHYKKCQQQWTLSQQQVAQTGAQLAASQASLHAAQTAVLAAKNNMTHYRIYAPIAGTIAKRYVLVGDMVEPGQAIYTLNDTTPPWVAIYLEETKYRSITLHQEVDFTIDAYPELSFKGRIFYIGSNTASEFALIPPSNASGNYTKVTQRIPVKVSIDEAYNKHLKEPLPTLISGMSVNVKIIK